MGRYLELDVCLKDLNPRIWRRFRIRAFSTFADLHGAIQSLCGWSAECVYEFRTPGRPIAETMPLNECFREHGEWCFYIGDHGQQWQLVVKLTGAEARLMQEGG